MKKIMMYVIAVVQLSSCEGGFSCDEYAADFRDGYQCNMVVQKIEVGAALTTFYGVDLKTHKQTESEDGSKWIKDNLKKFAIGDSVIKKKGEYTIVIKRKGKTILIPMKCDERIYTDKAYKASDYNL